MSDVLDAWLRAVDDCDHDRPPMPVPVDELADRIRADGGLAEIPALALLDEIQRLRAALRPPGELIVTLDAGALSDAGLAALGEHVARRMAAWRPDGGER